MDSKQASDMTAETQTHLSTYTAKTYQTDLSAKFNITPWGDAF